MHEPAGPPDRRHVVAVLFALLVVMAATAAFAVGALVSVLGRDGKGDQRADATTAGPGSFSDLPAELGRLAPATGDDPGQDEAPDRDAGDDRAQDADKAVAPTASDPATPIASAEPSGGPDDPDSVPTTPSAPGSTCTAAPPTAAPPTAGTGTAAGGGVAVPVIPLCG